MINSIMWGTTNVMIRFVLSILVTVILSIVTNRSEQILQTHIRLLLKIC